MKLISKCNHFPYLLSNLFVETPLFKQVLTGAIAGIMAMGSVNMPAQALTKTDVLSLSYEQVKGSGLANRCPSVAEGSSAPIAINGGKKYKITELCLEPTNFQVRFDQLYVCGYNFVCVCKCW